MKRINNYQGGSQADSGCPSDFPICDGGYGMHYGKKNYCRNNNGKWMSDGPHGCTTREENQKLIDAAKNYGVNILPQLDHLNINDRVKHRRKNLLGTIIKIKDGMFYINFENNKYEWVSKTDLTLP